MQARWAAKEAIKKASSRRLTFADIMVLNESSGKPMGIILDKPAKMMQEVVLEKQSALGKGESARRVFGTRPSFPHMPPSHYWHLYDLKLSSSEKLYHDIEGQAVEVSISHEDEFAVASVILPNMLKSSEAPHESSVAMKPSEDHS